jgi:hypothetical protein
MMKRIIFLVFGLICSVLLYGQNTSVTNNNTIIIQGNVYYFRPSTTPSSPPPTQSSDFLGSGHWYGEDAARAWASIADWVIDRCVGASRAITGNQNERVYISAVYVFRSGDRDFSTYKYPYGYDHGLSNATKQVRIDYWVVGNGAQMADGRRETRWFGF